MREKRARQIRKLMEVKSKKDEYVSHGHTADFKTLPIYSNDLDYKAYRLAKKAYTRRSEDRLEIQRAITKAQEAQGVSNE